MTRATRPMPKKDRARGPRHRRERAHVPDRAAVRPVRQRQDHHGHEDRRGLRRMGIGSQSLAMDDYFRTVNPRTAPRTPEGDIDFGVPRVPGHGPARRAPPTRSPRREIHLPRYNFVTRVSGPIGRPMRLGKDEVAVCEGIHASMTTSPPTARTRSGCISARAPSSWTATGARCSRAHGCACCFASCATATPAPRRRDAGHGPTSAAGEAVHLPVQGRANLMFDSSFPCEVSILKNYAAPCSRPCPRARSAMRRSAASCRRSSASETIDPPPARAESMLREFIGGGVYSY